MRRRVHAAASLLFFLAAQASKLSLSWSLGWAEGALKCHMRNCDDGVGIEVLIVSSVFFAYLRSRACWAIELVEKLGLRPPRFFVEAPPPGYAALWSVDLGAGWCPVATR